MPRLAPRLRPGDEIRVVSPSSPALFEFPRRAERSLRALEGLGYRVTVGQHARGRVGNSSGTPAERAADLNDALRDPSVRLVQCALGGWTANALLPLVDWGALRDDPKILVGMSDVTILHAAARRAADLATFYGANAIPTLGPPEGPYPGVIEWWRRVLTRAEPPGEYPRPPTVRARYPRWETDEESAPREDAPNPPLDVRRGARAEGRLEGGCLQVLETLAGTPWFPDLDGAILAWEEVEVPFGQVERSLTHLAHTGAFDGVRAMLVGKPHAVTGRATTTLEESVLRAVDRFDFPVVFGLDFGHREPCLPLPLGCRARVDADGRLDILEPAVG